MEDVPVPDLGPVGAMSYVVSPSLRTSLNAASPVSSRASRMAAASGDSPGSMLPAGTCSPDSSQRSPRCRKTKRRWSRTM